MDELFQRIHRRFYSEAEDLSIPQIAWQYIRSLENMAGTRIPDSIFTDLNVCYLKADSSPLAEIASSLVRSNDTLHWGRFRYSFVIVATEDDESWADDEYGEDEDEDRRVNNVRIEQPLADDLLAVLVAAKEAGYDYVIFDRTFKQHMRDQITRAMITRGLRGLTRPALIQRAQQANISGNLRRMTRDQLIQALFRHQRQSRARE